MLKENIVCTATPHFNLNFELFACVAVSTLNQVICYASKQ